MAQEWEELGAFQREYRPYFWHLEGFSEPIIVTIITIILFSYKPHKIKQSSFLSLFLLLIFNKYLLNTCRMPKSVRTRCRCYNAEHRHLKVTIVLLLW